MNRAAPLLVLVLLASPVPVRAEHDECDAGFIAFLGAEAYQFSPLLEGDLGRVRLFTVLSHQAAAALEDHGRAFWRLEIRDESGRLVRAARGVARIDSAGQSMADFVWDGRDESGKLVPAGKYRSRPR